MLDGTIFTKFLPTFALLCFFYNPYHANGQFEALKAAYAEIPTDAPIGFAAEAEQKLAQIVLIRHGEPALKKDGWVNRPTAQAFMRAYDIVGVCPFSEPPLQLRPDEVDTVWTSNLGRAMHTAELAFGNLTTTSALPLFREFERKVFAFPNMRLPLRFWVVASRILWLIGANDSGIESFKEAKARAEKASSFLERQALAKGKTVLVAHGFLNRYLVKTLEKRGWTIIREGGSEYLATWLLVRRRKAP